MFQRVCTAFALLLCLAAAGLAQAKTELAPAESKTHLCTSGWGATTPLRR
jgi:hypothetical protein